MENSCFDFQWPLNSIEDQLHAHTPLFEYYDEPVMEPSSRLTKQFNTYGRDHLSMNQNLIQGCDSSTADQGTTIVKHKDETFVSSEGSNGFNCNYLVSSSHGGAKVMSTSKTSKVTSYEYQDHILAERKRREKLSQMFIALSALLPNLKKVRKICPFFRLHTYKSFILGGSIIRIDHLCELSYLLCFLLSFWQRYMEDN